MQVVLSVQFERVSKYRDIIVILVENRRYVIDDIFMVEFLLGATLVADKAAGSQLV